MAYPSLRFTIVMVCEVRRVWQADYFYINFSDTTAWTAVPVDGLARLYTSDSLEVSCDDPCWRYLTACALVRCQKLDKGANSRANKQNYLAGLLTGSYRKGFSLAPPAVSMECEICANPLFAILDMRSIIEPPGPRGCRRGYSTDLLYYVQATVQMSRSSSKVRREIVSKAF